MLSKYLKNLIGKKTVVTDEAAFAKLNKLEQAKFCINKINLKKGNQFNPLKASSISLQSIDSNIEKFILRIMQYTQTFKEGQQLTAASCFTEYKTTTVDAFFTDTDGCYISAEMFTYFVHVCKDFFEALDALAEKDKSDFVYSQRLLMKSFVSIQNICLSVEKTNK